MQILRTAGTSLLVYTVIISLSLSLFLSLCVRQLCARLTDICIHFFSSKKQKQKQKQAVDKQSELCQTVYKIVTSRPDHLCSFVDDSNTFGPDTKLVYRHFATLYFCILSDRSESELAMLDLIQVYVETLDRVFENVCELDLIFNSPKAYTVLDETVVGGLVLEINSQKILTVYDQLQKLEKMHSSLIDKLQVGS